MIVLGVDPGTANMGYGIIEGQGDDLSLLRYGCICTEGSLPLDQRLKKLYCSLTELIGMHHPDAVAVEELFFARNARTALVVGQARGVALLAAANANVLLSEYTPMQVKQAVTGYGGAKKPQVQEMVRLLLHLDFIPRPDDAADALAIAICHYHTAGTEARLAGA
jgi:crossover junction endodeoxyribonuclease RuvC